MALPVAGKFFVAVRVLPVLTLLCVSTLLSGAQQIPKAQKHFDLGMEMVKAGQYHSAADEFTKALEINPEFSPAYYQLGMASMADHRPEDAVRAFMQLAQLTPNDTKPILAAAQIYYGLGLFEDALALSVRALLIEPQNASIYSNMGMIYLQQGHPAQAAEVLEKAISLDSSIEKARLLLATAYVQIGERKKALDVIQRGVDLAPSPDLLAALAEIYFRDGQLGEAEKSFVRSINQQKNYLRGVLGLARVHCRQGRFPEGITELNDLLTVEPKNLDAVLERGICFYASGDLEAGRKDFEEFAKGAPDQPQGFYYLGSVYLDEKKYDLAESHFDKMLQLSPKSCDGSVKMAEVQIALAKPERAREYLAPCLSQASPDPRAQEILRRLNTAKTEPER